MPATNTTHGTQNANAWTTQADPVDADAVLGALDDETSRTILEATSDEALTATELADRCDIPSSTAYRKVETLAEADLLEASVRINTTGKHPTEYRRAFDDVVVSVAAGGVEVELTGADAGGAAAAHAAVADD